MEYVMLPEIPDPINNLQLADPELLTYYRNLERRVIWLDSELDNNWLEFGKYILDWNRLDKGVPVEERTPIKLYFFSPGGDLDINNFFIDIVKMSKTPVIGINMGIAYSGGAFTYLACHKRYVMPKASFLLHKGSAEGFSGTAQQIEEITAQYKKQVNALKDYLVECGLDKKLVNKKMGGEWFIDSEEAVKLGIAHSVVTDIDEIF